MQLIILGMHRSGTSVLARLLNMMGAYFAAEGLSTGANQENPKGFWERRDVRILNDMLLQSVDCDWNRVANFDRNNIPEAVLKDFRIRAARIVLDMDAHRPWLLKEPRLCLLFPLWREFFEVPHCIHIFRNPLEVALSLKKRNGIPIEAGCALWEKYNIEAFSASAGLPRILVSHHQLMVEPASVATSLYNQLTEFGIQGLRKPSRQEITSFVRDDLYRERSGKGDLKTYVNAEQLKLFQSIESGQILRKKKIVPFSEKGRLALSSYEAALGPLQKSSVAPVESPEAQLRKQLAQREQEAKAAVEKAGKLEAALKDHDAKVQAATMKEHELQTQLALKAQEAKAALDTAAKLEVELKNLSGKNQEISKKEHELQTQLALKAQEAKAALDTAARLEVELKNLNGKNQEISKKGHELQTQLALKEQEAKAARDVIVRIESELKSRDTKIQDAAKTESELHAKLALKEREFKETKGFVAKLESQLKSQDIKIEEASRSETELQVRLALKEREAKTATEILAKLKDDLRGLEEKNRELYDEKNKLQAQLTHAKQISERASVDLKAEVKRRDQEISRLKDDIRQLNEVAHQLVYGADRLIQSRRWKIGHFIASLRYRLLFRPVPPISADYIGKVKDKYNQWLAQYKHRALALKNPAENSSRALGGVSGVNADDGISIVVLNRDGAHHLKNLFESFLANNKHKLFEFIVVDHASSDNSLSLLNEYQGKLQIRVVRETTNKSFSCSNNNAASLSRYENLLFVNNDIIIKNDLIPGILNHLKNPEIGIVGIDLYYPGEGQECGAIQHAGIRFNEDLDYQFFRPYNIKKPGSEITEDVPAVTGAFFACRKKVFLEAGKFFENYFYGYEDVDLCLSIRKFTKKRCVIDHRLFAVHDESATQKKDANDSIKQRRLNNINTLISRYGYGLKRAIWQDACKKGAFWVEARPVVGFAVTEDTPETAAGDYFTAFEFAEYVQQELGFECRFLPRQPKERDWYDVAGIDILVVMLDAYDLSKMKNPKPSLIKVAWMRNWFDRWASKDFFGSYDLYFCSSEVSAKYIREVSGYEAHVFRIATNHDRFSKDKTSREDSDDYCFTGSFWNAEREIEKFDPEEISAEFKIYGHGWDSHSHFKKYWKGFVKYFGLPEVYRKTKIVIDDANHVTKPWASVNSRVFDAIASGSLVITNGVQGAKEVFQGALPTYNSPRELKNKIEYYLAKPQERVELVSRLRSIVLAEHTYSKRSEQFGRILENYRDEKYRIAIKIGAPNYEVINQWGDYHFALAIQKQFKRFGHSVRIDILPEWYRKESFGDNVVIVLRGLSEYKPVGSHVNLMWNISHPEKVSYEEYERYDHVFVASELYAAKLKEALSVPVSALLQCTDPELFFFDMDASVKRHDVLFVGNSRKQFRKIVKDAIGSGVDLSVYGAMWVDIIPRKYIAGEYIENSELRKYYSSCNVLLNDHWEDMSRNGFVSNRLFDALACGAVVISDDVPGLGALFGDRVLTYDGSIGDLSAKLAIARDAKKSEQRVEAIRAEIKDKHTFAHRVRDILRAIETCNTKKSLN